MPRAATICSRTGCPERATFRGMCSTHASEYEKQRGLPAQRGYDYRYRKQAKATTSKATHCSECGSRFTASNPATAGHRRAIRNGGTTSHGLTAQCRRCNYGWRRTGL